MERTQTNNAARALRLLCNGVEHVSVVIRYDDPKRPGMAAHASGDLIEIISMPDGDTKLVFKLRDFMLSTIEAIEIKGGLGDARRNAKLVSIKSLPVGARFFYRAEVWRIDQIQSSFMLARAEQFSNVIEFYDHLTASKAEICRGISKSNVSRNHDD